MKLKDITNNFLYDTALYGSAVVTACLSFSKNGAAFSTHPRVTQLLWKRFGYGMQVASFFASGLPHLLPYSRSALKGKPSEQEINNVQQCLRANAWMTFTTHFIKLALKQKRPDAHTFDSFPSGHTMATTVNMLIAAQTLSRILQEKGTSADQANNIAYGVAVGYSLTVGLSRVLCQRHTLMDVMAGFGLGAVIAYLHIQQIQ